MPRETAHPDYVRLGKRSVIGKAPVMGKRVRSAELRVDLVQGLQAFDRRDGQREIASGFSLKGLT